MRVDVCSQFAQECVCFGQILAISAFPFEEIWNRIEPEPVHAESKPKRNHPPNFPDNHGIVIVEVRLMRIKSMEVIRLRHWIPRPVGRLKIRKDYTRILIALGRIAP